MLVRLDLSIHLLRRSLFITYPPRSEAAVSELGGAHVVFDGVGASTFDSSLRMLRKRGLMVSFGNASGAVPPVSPLRLLAAGSVYLTRPKLGDYCGGGGGSGGGAASGEEEGETLASRLSELFRWAEEGVVRPKVCLSLPLSRAQDAHEYIEAGKTDGKVLLLMP